MNELILHKNRTRLPRELTVWQAGVTIGLLAGNAWDKLVACAGPGDAARKWTCTRRK